MFETEQAVLTVREGPAPPQHAHRFKGLKRILAAVAPDLLVVLWRLRRAPRTIAERRERSADLVRRQFRDVVGETLHLEAPAGLSEKIARLKIGGATALQRTCADKITARRYVEERVGPEILSRTILTTYRLSRINPREIREERFVIKTNHDSGGVIVCTDRSRLDWADARLRLADKLAFDHYRRHREPVYRGIRPGLLVEEYLEADAPEGLREYKIFCMNGEPRFVMTTRESGSARVKAIFDTEWNRLPVRRRRSPVDPGPIRRPERLGDLLDIARRLAEPFPFCRVDLYENRGRIIFGEMTFFPEGGNDVFDPPDWELRFGEMLQLPPDPSRRAAAAR